MSTSLSMIASTDGSSPPVNLGKGTYPTFSPDETAIVYISRESPTQVVVAAVDGTTLHAHPGLNGANATENQHKFSPDSKHVVLQAGVWYDHRLLAIDVATGIEFELLTDDGLNKLSPQVVSVPVP